MLIAVLLVPLSASARKMQQHFKHQLPPGNYSGICALGDSLFAVVDDKAPEDGFYLFRISIDEAQRRITEVENLGYRSSGLPNRDMEGICYRPATKTLFISGEADNRVYEYTLDGQRTGQQLQMPAFIGRAETNYGLEALTYDHRRHLFITTTEHPLPGDSMLRIMTFSDDMTPNRVFLYRPDEPLSEKHIHGVSALCALSDGRLLVLERQVRIPRLKIGASALTRIYEVVLPEVLPYSLPDVLADSLPNMLFDTLAATSQQPLEKRLVTEFKTRLNLFSRQFANFEGLCQVSPSLVLLVADSQNRHKGILKDWFRLVEL